MTGPFKPGQTQNDLEAAEAGVLSPRQKGDLEKFALSCLIVRDDRGRVSRDLATASDILLLSNYKRSQEPWAGHRHVLAPVVQLGSPLYCMRASPDDYTVQRQDHIVAQWTAPCVVYVLLASSNARTPNWLRSEFSLLHERRAFVDWRFAAHMKVLAVMSQQYNALHAAHLRIWERRELCLPGQVYRFGGTEGSQMITDLTYLLAWRPLSDKEVALLHKAAAAPPPGFGLGAKGSGLGAGEGRAKGLEAGWRDGVPGGKLAAAAAAAPTEGDPLDKAEAVVGVLAAARRMGGGSLGALTAADQRLLRQSRNQCLQAMVESVLLDDLEHLVRACDVYSRLNPDSHAGGGGGGGGAGHHTARSASRGYGHAHGAWGAGGHASLAASRDMGPPSAPPSAHPSRVGGRGLARGPEAEAAAIVEAAAAAAAVKGHVFWMRGVGGNSLSDIVSKMSPLEPRPSFLTVAGLPLTAVAAERSCQPRLLLHLVAAGAEVNVYALRFSSSTPFASAHLSRSVSHRARALRKRRISCR